MKHGSTLVGSRTTIDKLCVAMTAAAESSCLSPQVALGIFGFSFGDEVGGHLDKMVARRDRRRLVAAME